MAFSYANYNESDAVKRKRQEAEAHSTYNESDAVRLAREAMQTHEANKVADWTGGTYGQSVKDALDKINNREKFTYDLNGDALYQQYKDQYMNLGKLAMQDTIGQASAMTGGYGNSYAATAGNQAYQGYLQKLNDVVPELYQMALNQYNQEGQDLKDNLAMYQSLYGTEYGEYRDKVSDWNTEQARLSDAYNNERTFDYSKFSSDRDYYNTAYNNERTYDYGQYSDAYNRAFAQYQQQVSEDQWAKNYALDQAQLAETKRANDQSSTISALKDQLNQQNDDAVLYSVAKDFEKSIMSYSAYNEANKDVYGPTLPYSDYVKAQLREAYNNGKGDMNKGTLEYLLDKYGIK